MAEPIARWYGGKKLLAARIIDRIDAIPHDCYAEPFVGMGGVFLRRRRWAFAEVINDLNGNIVNLFRVMQHHPDELIRQFEWPLYSRAEFERLVSIPPDTLTDIQRAARFVEIQSMSYSGHIAPTKKQWAATAVRSGRSGRRRTPQRQARMRRLITAAHRRLMDVYIEQLPWAEFVKRYDRPRTLFYIDPPYWGHEAAYGKGLFERGDFVRMAELLRSLQGKFLLTIGDQPEVREMFDWASIDVLRTSYMAGHRQSGSKRSGDLLIFGGGGCDG